MSITTGVGLVSQVEKFGREIAGAQYKNYFVIEKFDFAYNKSSTKEYPEGYIAMHTAKYTGAVPNSIFTCFRVKQNKAEPFYLNYLFQTNLHGQWLRKFIAVGARANGALNVDNSDLLSAPIPVPTGNKSIPEQQRIAACLSSLDAVIKAQTDKLSALRHHKTGLMQQLFPAEGETVPKLRFPEFEGAGEWEIKPLQSVANYENGSAYEKDIVDSGRYIVVNARFISTDGLKRKYSDKKYCIASQGDILMVLSDLPKGKALAKCFYVDLDDRYAVNQRICKLRPYGINRKFLFYTMNRKESLLAYDDGMNQTHLKKESVLQCALNLPPKDDEQQRIADCLSSLDTLIDTQSKKVAELKTFKRGLMQGLFPAGGEE